jgi:putative transposase
MCTEYAFSERRACGLMLLAVSSYRYQTRRDDGPLRARLMELAWQKPRYGCQRLLVLLRRTEVVNHKRARRVYREAGLTLRRKKRKHCVRAGLPPRICTQANQEWALDFVHDTVECGRTIRVLSVVDAYTRECLALEVDTSFASRRVTRVLEEIIAERGQPQAIRCDNELNASSNLQRGDSIPGDRPEGRQVVHGAVFDAAGAVVFHDEKRPRSS